MITDIANQAEQRRLMDEARHAMLVEKFAFAALPAIISTHPTLQDTDKAGQAYEYGLMMANFITGKATP